ncbi:aldo/keto reductase [Promicromonospora iranensis]|uniref:aldo/keto reductase n=1 Tax=Promicromonospora iranensis TaxID=1105144 RepID=UPI0023A91957|nr:aldo/keto reductase [Promicromonospora iranensis]
MSDLPLRRLGRSGLSVPVIGLGCNNLGRTGTVTETGEGATALVDAAIDAGVTFFDTADRYGARPGLSEELLGAALKGRRDDVLVATKFGLDMGGANGTDFGARGSRRYIVRAAEASLRRLGTDWIDLYQLHTPDPATPVDETLAALDDLVRSGKVRYVGHSNLQGWQVSDAEHVARSLGTGTRFVSAQNEYSLLSRGIEREVLPAARAYGIGVLPYFPLANGLLTGKYSGGARPDGSRLVVAKQHLLETAPWEALDRFGAFCRERDVTETVVAFSWLLSRPEVSSVIAGATRPEQVRANAKAWSWTPTAEDLAELDEIFPA